MSNRVFLAMALLAIVLGVWVGRSIEENSNYSGEVHIANGSSVEVAALYAPGTRDLSAVAIVSEGLRPSGRRLPSLDGGETYLLIQSTDASSPTIKGQEPVLDLEYKEKDGTLWRHGFYVVSLEDAIWALEELENLLTLHSNGKEPII